ncbi:MAG: S-layer homology domain-containing protein [Microcoleaceae cyanobacterium]
MTQSSAPNTPNLPPPPEPPTSDPSRNRDEWIAVLVALLAMGGIFFWVFGTDRPNASLLGRRSGSSSTQVEELPSLSQLLQNPDSLDASIPSTRLNQGRRAVSGSNSVLLSPNSSAANRQAWQAWRLRTLQANRQQAQTAPEAGLTEEELPVPVEGETPLEATDTETPVEGETPTEATDTETPVEGETPTEATEEDTTEDPAVAPTDETETPDTEAEQSQDTDESEESTAQQSQRPRFGIPILGLGGQPDAEETPDSATEETEETPTEATVTSPEAEDNTTAEQPDEAEETPTEATATAPEEEAEQADGTGTSDSEEQATAKKPDKPSFIGIPIPGLGSNSSETETPAASSAEFSDVPDDFWAKDYVQYFAQQEIVTGYEDGTFKPEEPMSRAAVAAQIEDAFGFAENERKNALDFEDVGQEYWAESAIDETTKTGFLSGYPGDVFRPERPMTRTEVLVALVSGLDLKPSGDPQEILSVYKDADQIPAWAVEQVAAATEAGLVANYPNMDTFNPNEPATRAEVSAMIYQGLVQAGKVDPMSSEYIVNPKQ